MKYYSFRFSPTIKKCEICPSQKHRAQKDINGNAKPRDARPLSLERVLGDQIRYHIFLKQKWMYVSMSHQNLIRLHPYCANFTWRLLLYYRINTNVWKKLKCHGLYKNSGQEWLAGCSFLSSVYGYRSSCVTLSKLLNLLCLEFFICKVRVKTDAYFMGSF